MLRALWNFVASSIGGGQISEPREVRRHHIRHRRQYTDPVTSSSDEDELGDGYKVKTPPDKKGKTSGSVDENHNRRGHR